MEKVQGFLRTFFIVIVCIALYKTVVQQFTPTTVQTWIGI